MDFLSVVRTPTRVQKLNLAWNSITLPAKPSEGRPKLAVLAISVGAVAGARGVRLRMLKALNILARN